jgi:2-haloacid dehalogenase
VRAGRLVAAATKARARCTIAPPGLRCIKPVGFGIMADPGSTRGVDMSAPLPEIRALVFDVFGTVVDWRGSLIREGQALSARLGLQADWAALADAWRAGYQPAMARVARGELGWTPIDALHRSILDGLLPNFGLASLPETERVAFNRAWHRLSPWPDSVAGLTRLKRRYTIATLSNGNVALLVAMAKAGGLPWDMVFSAELFQRYKPDPAVYQGAARLLDLPTPQVLMVAAHPSDLAAAQRAGLKTAYIPRPDEHGPGGWMEPVGDRVFDLTANSLEALADQLA